MFIKKKYARAPLCINLLKSDNSVKSFREKETVSISLLSSNQNLVRLYLPSRDARIVLLVTIDCLVHTKVIQNAATNLTRHVGGPRNIGRFRRRTKTNAVL
ncbi:hypothetical protein RN001_013101 [Aquatica leii]|uniref:Uncharacterized protein n=1 Tax=Aquatica leii TaxID=1421715 RepID=A0AAN7P3X5_9COLE|nr:hypothetical protein RN001_013101 [Aquatica leii]